MHFVNREISFAHGASAAEFQAVWLYVLSTGAAADASAGWADEPPKNMLPRAFPTVEPMATPLYI